MTEAVTCLSGALTAMGMSRILIAHLENKASIRVAEKSEALNLCPRSRPIHPYHA